jgi:hypothetical protein
MRKEKKPFQRTIYNYVKMKIIDIIKNRFNFSLMGTMSLIISTLMLLTSFVTHTSSNIPLTASLLLMLVGITFIVLGIKRQTKY